MKIAIQTVSGKFVSATRRAEGRPGTGEPMYETTDYDRDVIGSRRMGETSGTADYLSRYATTIGLRQYETAAEAENA